jgi:hypothetical protein
MLKGGRVSLFRTLNQKEGSSSVLVSYKHPSLFAMLCCNKVMMLLSVVELVLFMLLLFVAVVTSYCNRTRQRVSIFETISSSNEVLHSHTSSGLVI